jgi:hypothetical protein
MSEPILTAARRSVWSAIENWPALEGTLKRVWKFEDTGAMQLEPIPTIGDLPALAIYPSEPSRSDWYLNQSQRIPYTLNAQLWTRHWSLLAGERIWEEIAQALFQSAPMGQPPYVLLGTGYNGVDLGPLSARRVNLGHSGPICTLWEWTIGLRISWNPADAT